MKYWIILPLLLSLLLSGCDKEERTYDKKTIIGMAKKIDPQFKDVLPESLDKGLKCSDYGEGCVSAFEVKTHMVKFAMIRFIHVEQARRVATKLEGYYVRNWVFDNVTGEPVLEHFVKRAFNAKRGDDPQVILVQKNRSH